MGAAQCAQQRRMSYEYEIHSDDEDDEQEEVAVVSKVGRKNSKEVKRPSLMQNAKLNAAGLKLCDLEIEEQGFDPTKASIKKKLLGKLGMEKTLEVNALRSPHGFNNEGLWTISHPRKQASFVMKMVEKKRGECEKFQNLALKFPGIASDPLLTFPSHVVRCINQSGKLSHELIVLRVAPGACLHEYVNAKMQKDAAGAATELMQVFEMVGGSLAKFHAKYGNKQHADFQPANIFYDEAQKKVTFIDLADMGRPTAPAGSDVQQFASAIKTLYSKFGPGFAQGLERRFRNGYATKR